MLELLSSSACGQFWQMFHVQLMSAVFHTHQLGQLYYLCCSNPLYPYWLTDWFFFVTESKSYWERCVKIFYNCGFLHFSILFYQILPFVLLGVHKFIIVTSLCWNDHFIVIKYHFLSLIMLVALKSTLSDINIGKWAFFWLIFACYIFFHPFTFNCSEFL